MWKLKGCSRCEGDLLIEKDQFDGWFELCIQCGFRYDLKELVKATEKSDSNVEVQVTGKLAS